MKVSQAQAYVVHLVPCTYVVWSRCAGGLVRSWTWIVVALPALARPHDGVDSDIPFLLPLRLPVAVLTYYVRAD